MSMYALVRHIKVPYLLAGHLGVLEHLLDGLNGRLEHSRVDLLESRTSDVSGEVLSLEERVDFDGGLRNTGKSPLGALACASESSDGPRVF